MVQNYSLFDKLDGLTDLETAVLICIVAGEHCIVNTRSPAIDDLEHELRLIADNIFGLSHAAISCSPDLSVQEFCRALIPQTHAESTRFRASPLMSKRRPGLKSDSPRGSRIPNVIIARDLDQAQEDVQQQVVELLNSGQISMGGADYRIPEPFIFIPIVASNGRAFSPYLNKHLKDRIFISHYHDPNEGFANLEDDSGWLTDQQSSTHSPVIRDEDIRKLRELVQGVTVSQDIVCYMHHITVFLRLNRAVVSGISPTATRHFHLLARCLAPFQGVSHVPPSLVAAAAEKVYRHRIVISKPENDRSLLYGSTLEASQMLLADATPENTIEQVLAQVEVPL